MPELVLQLLPLCMCLFVFALLLSGYPVAFSLAGASLLFMGLGLATNSFDGDLIALPERIFNIAQNSPMLMTVPLFIFMGVMLERSKLAEDLLEAVSQLFGSLRGGLAVAVILVGAILAASTAIVGATVVTLGLLAVPTMLRNHYSPSLASGVVTASGTLGQIIPPSIILILLADQLTNAVTVANAEQSASQNNDFSDFNAGFLDDFSDDFGSDEFGDDFSSTDDMDWTALESSNDSLADGITNGITNGMNGGTIAQVSVQDLFAGAMLPGLLLVMAYITYVLLRAWLRPADAPGNTNRAHTSITQFLAALLPPLGLIVIILGSILFGWASLTAAAAFGALGATVIAWGKRRLSRKILTEVAESTVKVTAMVFMILVAAQFFALIFRGFGGDEMIHAGLAAIPGGVFGAMLVVMLIMFLLGFVLDFFEITFIVVPLVGPVLLGMGVDPIWLGVMIAMNLQTSFLTPPFGFALFYYRGVAPTAIKTRHIYRGVLPFIGIQISMLCLLALSPSLATWLPSVLG